MRVLITLLLLIFCFNSKAQDFLLDSAFKEKYRFINWERNRLDFYGESPAFQKFFQELDAIYNGKDAELNIFHIGGSHIQADIYSHRVRRYLHNMKTGMKAERGLVFPYTLAGTNNPWNYKIEFTGEWEGKRNSVYRDTAVWGMEGITAQTTDSITTVRIFNRRSLKYRYNYSEFRVFCNHQDSMYCVEATDTGLVSRIEINKEYGYVHFWLKERVEEFEFRVRRTSQKVEPFVVYGFDLKNDDPGVIYHSIGVNGSSFATYRRCELFEEQLALYPPDMFIISVGTNDTYTKDFDSSQYENYYEDFMKMVWRINPDAAIVLTVPNDSYYRRRYANPHTATAARAIERLAEKYEMAVWNFYEIMGGKASSQRWYRNKLMPSDRIHFTGKGYDIKADLFLMAFYEAWDSIMGRPKDSLYKVHIDPNDEIRYYAPLAQLPDVEEMIASGDATSHTVRSGESLGVIAQRYGVSVNELMEWNDLNSTVIHPGDELILYGAVSINPQREERVDRHDPVIDRTSSGDYAYYTIRSGDTLWDIAVANDTSVERIQQLNPGLNARNLKVGQKIKIDK